MFSLPAGYQTFLERSQHGRAYNTRLVQALAHFRTWLKASRCHFHLSRVRRQDIDATLAEYVPACYDNGIHMTTPKHEIAAVQKKSSTVQAAAGLELFTKLDIGFGSGACNQSFL